ncbi:MAG: hypothetical protein C5B50_05900 [Verrucomicrobia bacterium]|nr:MAG: hypothetical protein C5B50_05900 [Verrucomicrobiota bacterium]
MSALRFGIAGAAVCLCLAALAKDFQIPTVTAPGSDCLGCLGVGTDVKIKTKSIAIGAKGVKLSSSDPSVAEVLQNGWVIGLKPGRAWFRDGVNGESFEITVTNMVSVPRDPGSIKQFDDNRRFELNGRLCVGSELCGHVLGVPNKGVLKSNRIINPAPLDPSQKLLWEVAPNTEVLDGAGVRMGTVAPVVNVGGRKVPASAFNFGMSKIIRGHLHLYGFGTAIILDPAIRKQIDAEGEGGLVHTSAWIPLDSVVNKEGLIDRFGLGRGKLPALPLEKAVYRITGGNPKAYVIPEGELAIVKEANGPVPSHYLRRPSGTINVLYSVPGFGLGGQGLDSFLISEGLKFRPARGVRSFVQPTYYPKKHSKARQVAPMTMTFLYGAVEASGCEPVFGWVAKEALAEEKQ